MGLVASAVPSRIIAGPLLGMRSELVLVRLLVLILTYAVPHGRKLRDLVPWSQAAVLLRIEHLWSLLLTCHHGSVVPWGLASLMHPVVLPALPD